MPYAHAATAGAWLRGSFTFLYTFRTAGAANMFFASSKAKIDNGDPQNHPVGFTVTADASLYVCVDPVKNSLNKKISAEVVLQNGQKVLDTTNAVASLFSWGWPWQGKEAEAKVAHIPNFRAIKVYLDGCPCGSSS